jgi:3-oxoacyl-[acyl-carrier-protein] synthase-3
MGIQIIGTGSYVPSSVETNDAFINHQFLNEDGTSFKQDNDIIIKKFKSITGIGERRLC